MYIYTYMYIYVYGGAPPSTHTHTAGMADVGRRAAFCTPVMFIPCGQGSINQSMYI